MIQECTDWTLWYRYSKNDGQLHKALEQVMERLVDYFEFQGKFGCPVAVQEQCFAQFLQFVDHMAIYFSSVGIGSKFCKKIIKITKMQPIEIRCKAASEHSFSASSLHGSASLWETAAPPLRVALESTSKDECGVPSAEGNELNGGSGRRKRARVRDYM